MHQLINPRKLSNYSAWIFLRGSWPHLDERYLEGRRRHVLEELLGEAVTVGACGWRKKAVSAPLKAMARHEVDIQLPSGYD